MSRRACVSLRWAVAGAVVAGALVGLGRRRETRATERLVDRLLRGASPVGGASRTATESLGDLPAPVRRYLETALPADWGANVVRVEQEGTLRVGGVDSPWKSFTATHHATVQRPGFVWDATVALVSPLSVRVRDALVDEEASARVTLFGAFPLGGATAGPELNEAALQRYLAEAVWYPAALLPENGVEWEALNDRSARATLSVGETTTSVVFHFTSETKGRWVVERVHADSRYRAVGDGFEARPWTGRWHDYEERSGVVVPMAGAVVWHLPDGDLHAWRGRVSDIEYRQ